MISNLKTPHPIAISTALLFAGLALAGCNSPKEREAHYIMRGNVLFNKGEYDKALVEYKNAARIMPADPDVTYRFGLVSEAKGDFRGAFEGFTHAEQQDAHFHPAMLKLAEYYLAAGQTDEAQKRIDTVLAEAPDDASAHAVHAAFFLRQKDFAGTEKEARTALSNDAANIIAFSVLTELYVTQGDNAKALATADDGIARNPQNLSLRLLKTGIYERQGDIQKIAESFQDIFKLAPDDLQYRVKLALTYIKAGRIDDAEAALRAGVAALPDNWDMKRQLVTFLGDHRGIDAAEKEIRSYMQAYPDKPELNTWLVDLYVSHDAIDRAVTFLNQVIAKHLFDRQGLDARTAMARIDYIKGDKDAAGKLAAAVLENDPNNLDALFIKAHIEADNGLYQNAVTDLRTIIRVKPKAKEALHLLAEILYEQGHLDLAIDTLNGYIETDPSDLAARVRLAQMYSQNGDSKHAMDLLFFVTKTDPTYPPGWETTARVAIGTKDWPTVETAIQKLDGLKGQHLTAVFLRGLMLANTGKTEDAIKQYTEAINADPASPLAEHALKALVAAYNSLKRPEEATRYIESLKSSNPAVKTILGESRLTSGKSDQAAINSAAADFDAAIAVNATHQEPYLDRARMFMFDHKPDQAIDVLKKGAAAAPADIRASLMEAEILGNLGRIQEAIALYDDLLARNPELDAVANNLAEIIADYQYADPAALAKAQHVAERFVASPDPMFLDTLAWVYYRQGDIQQAQTIMQRAVSTGAQLPPQIHYHYGAILMKAGKTTEAKAELQKATAGDANYPGLDDAKKLLAGL